MMICMCTFFVGCKNSKAEKEPVKVQLTTENYKEYLSIFEGAATYNTSKKYDSLLGIYKYSGSANATIEISSMDSNNNFENVIVEFKILAWGDRSYDYELKLNTKGEAKKNISTTVSDSFSDPSGTLSDYILRIESISGYVLTYN